jgi:hypothetical protein
MPARTSTSARAAAARAVPSCRRARGGGRCFATQRQPSSCSRRQAVGFCRLLCGYVLAVVHPGDAQPLRLATDPQVASLWAACLCTESCISRSQPSSPSLRCYKLLLLPAAVHLVFSLASVEMGSAAEARRWRRPEALEPPVSQLVNAQTHSQSTVEQTRRYKL